MPRIAKLARSALLMSVLASLSACAGLPADVQDSRLALQRGFFSVKYTFDDAEPESVYGFIGYNSSFTELLSQQPEALAEARSAEGFMYVSLAVSAIGIVVSASELIAALTTDNSTLAGLEEQEAHLARSSGAALGAVIWSAILGIPIRNRLYNSVRSFNAGLTAPDLGSSHSGVALEILPSALGVNPVTRQVDVGWNIRH